MDKKQLNKKFSNLIGKKVLLGCEDGSTLSAKINDIKLISVFIPYFDFSKTDCIETEDLLSDEIKAQQFWNYGNYFIAAQFTTNKCVSSKIVFAVPTNIRLNFYKEVFDNKDELSEIVLDSLPKTNVYISLQNEYEKYAYANPKWWQTAYQTVWCIQNKSEETYVLMNQVAGSQCGDYYFTTFSIAKYIDNKLAEIQFLTAEDNFYLLVAADIDGDGQIEFILDNYFGKRTVLKLDNNNQFRIIYEWKVPYMNDPC